MSSRKSKARIVAATDAILSPSRTPTFQPPSYYAAAAGLQYSPNRASNRKALDVHTSNHNASSTGGAPLSYPTTDHGHERAPDKQRDRSSSFTRAFSRALPHHQHQERSLVPTEDKRRSQMAEIPFLEAQLLPSLRDTIDKMTHPPRTSEGDDRAEERRSENTRSHMDSSRAFQDVDTQERNVGLQRHEKRSPLIFSPRSPAAPPVSYVNPPINPSSPLIPASVKPPKLSSSSNRDPPRMESSSPARSSSKLPLRNASALRADAMLSPASVPIPVSPGPGKSPSRPSRMDREEYTSQLAPVPSNSKLRSPNLKSPSSRLAISGPSHSPDPTRNNLTSRVRQVSSSQRSPAPPAVSRSNIPRPNVSAESGSEIEMEYKRRLATGPLVVANAEVTPSSSDSEHDPTQRHQVPAAPRSSQSRRREKTSEWAEEEVLVKDLKRQGHLGQSSTVSRRSHTREGRESVGLGFNFDSERNQRDRSYEDRAETCTDENSEAQSDGRCDDDYSPRTAHTARNEEHQMNRDDSANSRRSLGLSDTRKRREVLMGLLNGLQIEYDAYSSGKARESYDYEEEDYRYSGGIVVTESMDMEDGENRFDSPEVNTRRAVQGRSRDGRESSRNAGSKLNRREDGIPPEITARSRRNSGRSAATPPKDKRSSSLPPGSRSASRAHDPSQLEERGPTIGPRDQEVIYNSRQAKSRHRISMSVDQSSGLPWPSLSSKSRSKHDDTHPSRPADHRRDLAAREREAFGIPASLSYAGADQQETSEPRQATLRILSHITSESELSIVGRDDVASHECGPDGLSREAEALFDKLSSNVDRQQSDRRKGHRRQSVNDRQTSTRDRTGTHYNQQQNRPASLSLSCSTPSVYDHELDHDHSSPHLEDTWRSLLHPKVYDRLLISHGQAEIQRQEVLYKFYNSQRQLVSRLRSTVKTFIVPLRRKHSKNWIPGIPTQASRLFDWLEDIVNLHVAIAEALQPLCASWESGNIAVNVAKALRGFVPRLEVYQPYLMRFEEVRQMVTEGTDPANDDFAEYVRIREQRDECEGWTLADLLYQPVQHLSILVDAFEQMWKLTPRDHPEHVSAFSLYHSARMMVHVLWEVKVRENQYDFVKDISTRIEGLLPTVQLATRERRLLWHGDLIWRTDAGKNTSCEHNTNTRPKAIFSPEFAHSSHRTPTIVLSPCPDENNQRQRTSFKEELSRPISVHVLVFTDVLIIGKTLPKPRSNGFQWSLLPQVGTARILRVFSQEAPGPEAHEITVELLPLKQEELQSGMIPDERTAVVGTLSVPARKTQADHDAALAALRRCYAYTLRSLSFPSHSGHQLLHGSNVDFEQDTQKSVMAILNTGLPLPKSPSIQATDLSRAGPVNPATDTDREREERGWWALRFQQILREMQRQDPVLSLQAFDEAQL